MKNTSIKSFTPRVAHSQVTSKLWAVHPTVIHDMEEGIKNQNLQFYLTTGKKNCVKVTLSFIFLY